MSDRSGALGTREWWPERKARPLHLGRFCETYPRKEVDHAGKNKPGKWWRNVRAAAVSGPLTHSGELNSRAAPGVKVAYPKVRSQLRLVPQKINKTGRNRK